MIIANLVPLLGSYANSGIMDYVIFPIMLIAFVAAVPRLIRQFWR